MTDQQTEIEMHERRFADAKEKSAVASRRGDVGTARIHGEYLRYHQQQLLKLTGKRYW